MDFERVTRMENGASVPQFIEAIDIWRSYPQTVNRRILASVQLLDVRVDLDIFKLFQRIITLDIVLLTKDDQKEDIDIKKLMETLSIEDLAGTTNKGVRLYVAKQLPRMPRTSSVGIDFLLLADEGICMNIHKPFSLDKQSLGPRMPFMLQQEPNGHISVSVYQLENIRKDSSIDWLEKKLLPSISKWAKSEKKITSMPLSSLNLISAEKYAKLYCELKEKYGKRLIENWPENTDPMKFVYEDIAIAAYLLLLWEKDRSERGTDRLQSFVDLGCGNGLLVYILFSEGHAGLGIDLRKRKIWDMYPPETPLQVSTVIPSSSTVYPGVDWIIGNHSDELTPWIPVIAARSSDTCRFFLLPCCPYELNGAKYQRTSASKSQYSDYIDYVKDVCTECGFTTHLDKLRIPSTKRVCLIGWQRTNEETIAREDRIRRMLDAKTTLTKKKTEASETQNSREIQEWNCDFKPRDTVEKVRNCTQLDKTLIADIVDTVSKQLLHGGRMTVLEGSGKVWNAGRCLELREIAESIPKDVIARLRNECGGLQTLLKNHSYIFSVAQGRVAFRIPGTLQTKVRPKRRRVISPRTKTKPCWFHENHPDGCPATEAECNFKH
ncbi:probable tRNA (uracil-O(2)-)-methyltransferase [Ceratina calcarata]|uniref:tRNA (uracil-O(2)-)-methyltransferase n=1 Tax=Ceratina calcarata TaxID=156304 RepID=A0AAJ7N6H5_9HYME|nr:probable tRNA (uracil-O(2)-)-methyltransferase [Ceratina calcarata]